MALIFCMIYRESFELLCYPKKNNDDFLVEGHKSGAISNIVTEEFFENGIVDHKSTRWFHLYTIHVGHEKWFIGFLFDSSFCPPHRVYAQKPQKDFHFPAKQQSCIAN